MKLQLKDDNLLTTTLAGLELQAKHLDVAISRLKTALRQKHTGKSASKKAPRSLPRKAKPK